MMPRVRRRISFRSIASPNETRGATRVNVIAAEPSRPVLTAWRAASIWPVRNIIDARIQHREKAAMPVDNFLVQDQHGRPLGEDTPDRAHQKKKASAMRFDGEGRTGAPARPARTARPFAAPRCVSTWPPAGRGSITMNASNNFPPSSK